jgi:large subunit ribosomal protein L21
MTYAVIRLGGRQFKVSKGDKIELERQSDARAEVLLYSDGKDVSIGTPILEGFEVKMVEIAQKKGKKIRVGRYKSKSRYRRVKGHKQPLSVFEIESVGKGKSSIDKDEEKSADKRSAKKAEKKEKKEEKPKAKTSEKKKKRGRPKKAESKKKSSKKTTKKRGRPKKKKE